MIRSSRVATFANVFREGEHYACEHHDAHGTCDVPAVASWVPERGTLPGHWRWRDPGHVFDDRCPACVSPAPCPQAVELYPGCGLLLVVHEEQAPAGAPHPSLPMRCILSAGHEGVHAEGVALWTDMIVRAP